MGTKWAGSAARRARLRRRLRQFLVCGRTPRILSSAASDRRGNRRPSDFSRWTCAHRLRLGICCGPAQHGVHSCRLRDDRAASRRYHGLVPVRHTRCHPRMAPTPISTHAGCPFRKGQAQSSAEGALCYGQSRVGRGAYRRRMLQSGRSARSAAVASHWLIEPLPGGFAHSLTLAPCLIPGWARV